MRRTTPSRWEVVLNLVKWEGTRILFSSPNYVAVFLSLCVAWLMLNTTLSAVREQGLYIEANPFLLPFLAALFPYAIFLSLIVAISLAREMEGKTIEVLFYAPIGFFSFTLGRFLGQMTYYLVAFPLIMLFFLGSAISVNLRITPGLLGAMALSPFTVASVVGFGLLVAACVRRTRSTTVILLVIISILLAVQVGHALLPAIPGEEVSSSVILLSGIVNVAYRLIEWVSPFVFLVKGVEAAQIGAPQLYYIILLGSIAYTSVTLTLSIFILRRKGLSQ